MPRRLSTFLTNETFDTLDKLTHWGEKSRVVSTLIEWMLSKSEHPLFDKAMSTGNYDLLVNKEGENNG